MMRSPCRYSSTWSLLVLVVVVGVGVAGIGVVGRGGESRAAVVLVLGEAKRIEPGRHHARLGLARDATAPPVHVGQAVERHGVAEELVVDEHARQRGGVAG